MVFARTFTCSIPISHIRKSRIGMFENTELNKFYSKSLIKTPILAALSRIIRLFKTGTYQFIVTTIKSYKKVASQPTRKMHLKFIIPGIIYASPILLCGVRIELFWMRICCFLTYSTFKYLLIKTVSSLVASLYTNSLHN